MYFLCAARTSPPQPPEPSLSSPPGLGRYEEPAAGYVRH